MNANMSRAAAFFVGLVTALVTTALHAEQRVTWLWPGDSLKSRPTW
jgi:hypothetical protein